MKDIFSKYLLNTENGYSSANISFSETTFSEDSFNISKIQLLGIDVSQMENKLAEKMETYSYPLTNLKNSETMTQLLNQTFEIITPKNDPNALYDDEIIMHLNLELHFIHSFLHFYQYSKEVTDTDKSIDDKQKEEITQLIDWLHSHFKLPMPLLVGAYVKVKDDVLEESFSFNCIEFQKMVLNTIVVKSCDAYQKIIDILKKIQNKLVLTDKTSSSIKSIIESCLLFQDINMFDSKQASDEEKEIMNEIETLINSSAKKYSALVENIFASPSPIDNNNMDEIFVDVVTRIKSSNTLNTFLKMMSPDTVKRIKYEFKNDESSSQSSKMIDYTFNDTLYRERYMKYTTRTPTTVFMKKSLEMFYYHVLSKKEAEEEQKMINAFFEKKIVTHNNSEFKQNVLDQYLKCFKEFVFKHDYRYLGLGAHLISMFILPNLPKHHLLGKWDQEYFEQDFENQLKTVLQNIDMVIENKNEVDLFHQDPYMLGFFTFLNVKDNKTAGTCQDNTLIQIMKADREDRFYGIMLTNYPQVTHWQIITGPGDASFDKDAIAITHDRVLLSKSIGTNIMNRKDKVDTISKSDALTKVDVQKIEKTNHQARANIFLAMTLAHVYRHTQNDKENNEMNGIAFRYVTNSENKSSSFEEAILDHIQNNIFMNVNKNISVDDLVTRLTSQKLVKTLQFESMKNVFTRKFDAILTKSIRPSLKRQNTMGGGGSKTLSRKKYEKYGKYNNKIVYKKNKNLYLKVKKDNHFVFKKIAIPEGIHIST